MHTRTPIVAALLVALLPAPGATLEAQGKPGRPATPAAGPTIPQRPDSPSPKPAPGVEQPAFPLLTPNASDPVNIRLDLTISTLDAKGAPGIPSKTATLYVLDRDSGRIRMQNGSGDMLAYLNVDATPIVIDRERIRVNLSLEYHPRPEEGHPTFTVNERLSAVVANGKQMIVSQTTDPGADRHVRVELKATISR